MILLNLVNWSLGGFKWEFFPLIRFAARALAEDLSVYGRLWSILPAAQEKKPLWYPGYRVIHCYVKAVHNARCNKITKEQNVSLKSRCLTRVWIWILEFVRQLEIANLSLTTIVYALHTYVLNRPVASFWGLQLSFLFPAEPVIQFTKERVFVAGPVVRNAHAEARITVKKTGDPFTRSKVRVYTLDGSAKAGKGYQAMTQVTRQKYFPYVNHLLNGYLCNMDMTLTAVITVLTYPNLLMHSVLGQWFRAMIFIYS